MNAALCTKGDPENWRQFILLNAGHALALARWGTNSLDHHLFDAIYYVGVQVYQDTEFHFEFAADEAVKETAAKEYYSLICRPGTRSTPVTRRTGANLCIAAGRTTPSRSVTMPKPKKHRRHSVVRRR